MLKHTLVICPPGAPGRAAASLDIFLNAKRFLLWRIDHFWLPRLRPTGVDLAVVAREKIQHAGDDAYHERSTNCRPEACHRETLHHIGGELQQQDRKSVV